MNAYEKQPHYVYVNNTPTYSSIPLPSLNGGLYTGEEFDKNSTYRNFPNKPDSVYMHTYALSSANPPPGISSQFPDTFRPGNNMPDTRSNSIKLTRFSNKHALVCLNNKSTTNAYECQKKSFIGTEPNLFNIPSFL
jgi:hypothetical protein